MVQLSKALKIIKAPLKSIEGSEITLKSDLTAGAFEVVMREKEEVSMLLVALEALIIDWNLEGDDKVKLEINRENLKLIPMFDLKDLLGVTAFGAKLDELQKKS